MGATEFFVGLSELPELNDLIVTSILYAPVAFLSNTVSVVKELAPFAEDIYVIL